MATYELTASRRIPLLAWRPEKAFIAVIGSLLSLVIIGPLIVVLFRSFQVEQGLLTTVYSFQNYTRITSPRTLTALANSLFIAAGSAVVASLWGMTLAWIVSRTNVPLRATLDLANLLPFFLSPLLGAIAWSYLGSPAIGLLNKMLMAALPFREPPINVYSHLGIIWVLGLFEAPFVYLFCIAALRQMDPALEHVARLCGSNAVVTAARITLPLAMPAILSSLILSFVLAIEDLGVPLVLGQTHGIQTLSTQIFEGMQKFPPDYNFGAALGCVLMGITATGILVQRRIMSARSFVTVTGRGYRPERLDLGWARYLALAVNLVYLLAAVLLPLGTLIVVSFSRAWLGYVTPSQFTPQYYVYLATNNPAAFRGMRNSLLLATSGATLGVGLATIIAYGVHRTRSRIRGWLDVVTSIPIGVPGLVLAIGLFVALIRTPLYATLWIILLAYVIRYFPYGQRSVSATMVSLADEFEESSRTTGANWFTTMRRILLPLLRPGLIAGWLLLFITFMREVSMSVLLARNGTETLSSALFSMMSYDPIGAASAFTLVQVTMILISAFVFLRIAGRESIQA